MHSKSPGLRDSGSCFGVAIPSRGWPRRRARHTGTGTAKAAKRSNGRGSGLRRTNEVGLTNEHVLARGVRSRPRPMSLPAPFAVPVPSSHGTSAARNRTPRRISRRCVAAKFRARAGARSRPVRPDGVSPVPQRSNPMRAWPRRRGRKATLGAAIQERRTHTSARSSMRVRSPDTTRGPRPFERFAPFVAAAPDAAVDRGTPRR